MLTSKIEQIISESAQVTALNYIDKRLFQLNVNELNHILDLSREKATSAASEIYIIKAMHDFFTSLWTKFYSEHPILLKNNDWLKASNALSIKILTCLDEAITSHQYKFKNSYFAALLVNYTSFDTTVFKLLSTAEETGIVVDPQSGKEIPVQVLRKLIYTSKASERYYGAIARYQNIKNQIYSFGERLANLSFNMRSDPPRGIDSLTHNSLLLIEFNIWLESLDKDDKAFIRSQGSPKTFGAVYDELSNLRGARCYLVFCHAIDRILSNNYFLNHTYPKRIGLNPLVKNHFRDTFLSCRNIMPEIDAIEKTLWSHFVTKPTFNILQWSLSKAEINYTPSLLKEKNCKVQLQRLITILNNPNSLTDLSFEEAMFYLNNSHPQYHRNVLDKLKSSKPLMSYRELLPVINSVKPNKNLYECIFKTWFELCIGKYPTGTKIFNNVISLPTTARQVFFEESNIQGLVLVQFMQACLKNNKQEIVYELFKITRIDKNAFIATLASLEPDDLRLLSKNFRLDELLGFDLLMLTATDHKNSTILYNAIQSVINYISFTQHADGLVFAIHCRRSHSLKNLGDKVNSHSFKDYPQIIYLSDLNCLQLTITSAEKINYENVCSIIQKLATGNEGTMALIASTYHKMLATSATEKNDIVKLAPLKIPLKNNSIFQQPYVRPKNDKPESSHSSVNEQQRRCNIM